MFIARVELQQACARIVDKPQNVIEAAVGASQRRQRRSAFVQRIKFCRASLVQIRHEASERAGYVPSNEAKLTELGSKRFQLGVAGALERALG